MKLVKIFIALAALILILLFLLRNTDEVAIDLIFSQFEEVSVAFVMLGALSIGILVGYGVAVTQLLTSKAEMRYMRTENRKLSDELNDLRNVAIDEGIYDLDDGEE